jgi:hypothetical protein
VKNDKMPWQSMEAKSKEIAAYPEIKESLFIEAHKLLITHKLRALETIEPPKQ